MKWILTISCLLFLQTALAKTIDYEPDVELGYRPPSDTDEGGLWYKVDKIEAEVQRSPYVIRDTDLNLYVEDMVCEIAGDYCDQIRVYLIHNPHFNASMYPNGMMHVYTGLLLRSSDEAQLAAVLGHEIAHYLRAHQIKAWRSVKGAATAAILLDIGLGALTGVQGLGTLMVAGGLSSYSRGHETEADIYGLQLLTRAGYNSNAAEKLWEYVEKERDADESKRSRNPFFASHPRSENRAARLRQESARLDSLNISGNRGVSSSSDQNSGQSSGRNGQEQHIGIMSVFYQELMDEQIALQEHEQTEVMLAEHQRWGYPSGYVEFYKGELYRQRKLDGDQALAETAYTKALASQIAPAGAHRELGYLLMKRNEPAAALDQFQQYLESQNGAEDTEMIKFYIESLTEKLK